MIGKKTMAITSALAILILTAGNAVAATEPYSALRGGFDFVEISGTEPELSQSTGTAEIFHVEELENGNLLVTVECMTLTIDCTGNVVTQ